MKASTRAEYVCHVWHNKPRTRTLEKLIAEAIEAAEADQRAACAKAVAAAGGECVDDVTHTISEMMQAAARMARQ